MKRPIIIAHRGASAARPEHTVAAYRLAIEEGADFIEPDLVITRDGVLVARHEPEISETTDVADHPFFASRRTEKSIDGVIMSGWFVEDFTLEELKRLRARERIPTLRPQNVAYDGLLEIPTFEEILALAVEATAATGRTIGIYPETKHPSYFAALGLPLEEPLLAALECASLNRKGSPVVIQSFETGNLRRLRGETPVTLIQLTAAHEERPFDHVLAGSPGRYSDLLSPAGLRDIATYADGIGPSKLSIVPRDGASRSLPPTRLVDHAHAAGLLVHPWTFRPENHFLPQELRWGDAPSAYGDTVAEIDRFLRLGVDGLFCDAPGLGVRARADFLASTGGAGAA